MNEINQQNRIEALRLAVSSSKQDASMTSIVEAAAEYYKFLEGDAAGGESQE